MAGPALPHCVRLLGTPPWVMTGGPFLPFQQERPEFGHLTLVSLSLCQLALSSGPSAVESVLQETLCRGWHLLARAALGAAACGPLPGFTPSLLCEHRATAGLWKVRMVPRMG